MKSERTERAVRYGSRTEVHKRAFLVCLLTALASSGCAARNYYPGARPADIIACRKWAYQMGPLYENGEFNNCMNEAGYKAGQQNLAVR